MDDGEAGVRGFVLDRILVGANRTREGVVIALVLGHALQVAGTDHRQHFAGSAFGRRRFAQPGCHVPIALRIRLQNQKLTEVETIVARADDYPAVDASPAALAASNDAVKWEQIVPMDQRAKREELTGWMEKYFERFPAGVCNTSSECLRIENGGGSFTCSAGASCAAGPGSGQPVLNPRLVMADVETGLGVGFPLFTGGDVDMHLFKMHGGQVHVVSAILANGASSGWD